MSDKEKNEVRGGAQITPVTDVTPAADATPVLTRERIIEELRQRYVGLGGRLRWNRAFKENPAWLGVLGPNRQGLDVVAKEVRGALRPDYDRAKEQAFARDLAAIWVKRGARTKTSVDAVPGMRDYVRAGGKAAYARIRSRAVAVRDEGKVGVFDTTGARPPQAYADGMPYCPHCGLFVQPWNRAYNAVRNLPQPAAPKQEETSDHAE